MQIVSDKWKSAHRQQMLNESFVDISIGVADPDAIVDASATDNGACYLANTSDVVRGLDRTVPNYATLEENLWLLDGNNDIVPDSEWKDSGFIGDTLSNKDCTFDVNPLIIISFSQVHTHVIPGVTVTWSEAFGEYAEQFRVTAYNGDTEVASSLVKNNTAVHSEVELDIANYNRITIEVIKWCLPYHRVRISDIFAGLKKIYTKKDIIEFSHEQEVDPICATTPTLKIGFSLDNSDNKFDPNNTTGFSKYLMERQKVEVRYGQKIDNKTVEYIAAGVTYLSEWDSPQNGLKATFVSRDLLEFMGKEYLKGLYNPTGVSLYDLAEDVLSEANLPKNTQGEVMWRIDDSLKSIYTTAPLPIASCAVCLQYIAQAARCVLYSDRLGVLHIEPISKEQTDYALTTFNLFTRPEISLRKPLSEVSTNVYNHFVDEIGKELFNGSVVVNGTEDVIITYSSTATNVSARVSGGTLVSASYYSNACYLKITGTGVVQITVSGDCLTTSNAEYKLVVSNDGESQTVDNPLISSTEVAMAVGNWVKENLTARKVINVGGWRSDTRLDATDIITSDNKYGTDVVRVTNVKYTYSGAFRGSLEGVVLEGVD